MEFIAAKLELNTIAFISGGATISMGLIKDAQIPLHKGDVRAFGILSEEYAMCFVKITDIRCNTVEAVVQSVGVKIIDDGRLNCLGEGSNVWLGSKPKTEEVSEII